MAAAETSVGTAVEEDAPLSPVLLLPPPQAVKTAANRTERVMGTGVLS
jgi:hypothetical protein